MGIDCPLSENPPERTGYNHQRLGREASGRTRVSEWIRCGDVEPGFQSIYALLNRINEIVCERVVYGAPGLTPEATSVHSLETQRSLEDFPVIAFSLSFEMDYLNAVQMIRLLGIRLRTRRETILIRCSSREGPHHC